MLQKLDSDELTLSQAREKLTAIQAKAQEQQSKAATEAAGNKGPRDPKRDVGKPPGGRPPAAAVYWADGYWRDGEGEKVSAKRDRKRKEPDSSEEDSDDEELDDEPEVKRIDPGFQIDLEFAKWLMSSTAKQIDDLREKALRLNTPSVWQLGTRTDEQVLEHSSKAAQEIASRRDNIKREVDARVTGFFRGSSTCRTCGIVTTESDSPNILLKSDLSFDRAAHNKASFFQDRCGRDANTRRDLCL